jgi:hypothetical protein
MRLSILALALLLPCSLLAQIRLGGASFSSGNQVVYSGGPSQPPEKVNTGLRLDLQADARPAETARLEAALDRFPTSTCAGTQVRLEKALRQRARARNEGQLPSLNWDLLQAMQAQGNLKDIPKDPEDSGNYSWWNFQVASGGAQVTCTRHPSWREAFTQAPESP